MHQTAARIALIWLACGAACSNPAKPPVVDANGVTHYTTSRSREIIQCDGKPIQLEGDRTEITLTGPCRFVRITGAHNDIETDIVAGGTIEITGSHNDVTWRLIEPGSSPQLLNSGESNTLHHSGNA
jgi:hypothetical protein